jgi:membrane fusion protein (multidrug efflux system)
MAPIHRFILVPIVFTYLFTITGCGSKSKDTAPRNAGSGTAMVVDGVVLNPRPLDNIVRSSGTILASESVDLTAETAGRVEKIEFKEGGHVQKNALLVSINDDDLQAQLKKTRHQIELASAQEQRQKKLLENNNTSIEQYDIALNQLNTLNADKENLIASIRKREIRAPFDGVVGLRYISEGAYVTTSTRIASIQKINPLKIDFSIPEKYAGKVSVGDQVNFSSDELKLNFTGYLYAIEPRIETATRTLQLRALCDNKSESILPGAYVGIDLRLKQITDALMIPTQAIIPVLKGQTVLVRRNGIVVSMPVTTGTRTSTEVQITSGLAAGDTVITTGLMQLRPGMPVTVQIK